MIQKYSFTKNTRFDIPESYAYKVPGEGIIDRVLKGIGRRMLCKTIWEKNQQKLIEGFMVLSISPFRQQIMIYQLIFQEADVIHLHWTAGFLDYRFFQQKHQAFSGTYTI